MVAIQGTENVAGFGFNSQRKIGKTGWWWFGAHRDHRGACRRRVIVRSEEVAGVGLLVVTCEEGRRQAEIGGRGFWLRKVTGFDPLLFLYIYIFLFVLVNSSGD